MGIKRRMIKNVLAIQIGDGLTKVIGLLFGIFVARKLPVEMFGQWLLVGIYFRIFGLFSEIGLGRVATRDIPRDHKLAGKYMIHLFVIEGILSFVLSVILIFTISLLKYSSQTTQLLYFAVPLLIINSLKHPLNITLMGLERMEITSAFNVGATLLSVLLGVIFLLQGYGVVALLWVGLVCNLISFVVMAIVIRNYVLEIRLEFDFAFCKYLLQESWSFSLSQFLGLMLYRLDFLFISKLKGETAVGIYGAAYRLIEPILFSIRGINVALRPTFSFLYDSSPEKVATINRKLMKLTLITPPILFLISIFSKEWVQLIYGEKFLPTKDIIPILAWGTGILIFTIPMKTIISISTEFPKFVFFRVLITILNVILNFILIPRYSYIGAAIATSICIALELPASIFIFKLIMKGTQIIKLTAKGMVGVGVLIGMYILTNKLDIIINATLPIVAYLIFLRLSGMLNIQNIKGIFKTSLSTNRSEGE